MNLKLAALFVQVTLITSCHVQWDVNWYDPEYQTPCPTMATTQATTQATSETTTEATTELDTTTLSELCQNTITATEECGFNQINKPRIVDEEQCKKLLELLKKFCGYEIYELSYNLFYKNF